MARPLRLEHPGAIWHVTSRGNAQQDIVRDDVDRTRFVRRLGDVVPAVRWRLHAWVLMTNHFHLLVETPDANLARGMQQLNSSYSQAFNRHHRRVGHVLQGRYKGILVERESHLLELVRYVVLNPVRAGMVGTPAEHRWSSYAETAGLRKAADWLDVDSTLAQFACRRSEARRRFRQFVSEGRGANYRPWDDLRGRVCLGSERFVDSLAALADKTSLDTDIPRAQRQLAKRPSCDAIQSEVRYAFGASEADLARRSSHPARKAFALLARRVADSRLVEIARPLGISARSASSLLSAAQALEDQDPEFKRQVRECQHRLLRRGDGCQSPT
jgi:REP element-mobilizing transposase RayT